MRAVKQGLVEMKDVITLWKLALYPELGGKDIADLVHEQLGDRTLQDLLNAHIKALLDEAKRQLSTTVFNRLNVNSMQVELLIGVPHVRLQSLHTHHLLTD